MLDTYPVALGVGLPAVVLVYADMRGLSSNGFLFAGLAFQLLGLLTVVVGIGQTRAEFGDSWNVAIRGWLERTAIAAGLKEAPPNRLSMSGTMPSPTMRGEMTDDLPADASPISALHSYESKSSGCVSGFRPWNLALRGSGKIEPPRLRSNGTKDEPGTAK